MEDIFKFGDDLGPKRIIHVHEPSLGLRGILVVDNVAAGPSVGGLRMAPDVSTAECFRLARSMTLKNAAAGLPHGGGKSVLFADPALPPEEKEKLIRAFACALGDCQDYIFGPDMGTDERAMAWVKDEIGRAVGLPPEVGGIPLDELGATGYGLYHSILAALEFRDFKLDGARVVIQGFGSVGRHAARFLSEAGAVIVGAADSRGSIFNANGLNVRSLLELKDGGKSVKDFSDGEALDRDAVIDMECEIWVPAARPDVINEGNMGRLKTKLVAPGANIGVTGAAEQYLHEKDVLCLPDFIANAGGVICAAMEYRGSTETAAFEAIREKISSNTTAVLRDARARNITPRRAAENLSMSRVKNAMSMRRWSVH